MINKEIERILEGLKEDYDGIGTCYYPDDILDPKDQKILYDYIIRLQKENKEIKEGTRPVISPYHGDAYITHEMEYRERKKLEQENKELHNKIDKAIEILENWTCFECDKNTMREISFNSNKENVLEILKDSDVDE